MTHFAVDKRPLRLLISSYDFPPIPYDLAEAFNRVNVEVFLLITSYGTEPAFYRFVIKRVNKFLRHFRFMTGKAISFFEKHPDDRGNWLNRCLEEACGSFHPDIVLFVHGHHYGEAILERLKIKKIAWHIEPDDFAKLHLEAAPFDIYTSFSSTTVERLHKTGKETAYLCHGVNVNAFYPLPETPKLYDLCFVGNWSPWREQVLQTILTVTHKVALYGPTWKRKTSIPRRLFTKIFRGEKIEGAALNLLYNQSKVVLNAQRERQANGLNMRYFEVTAARACLLTDPVAELEQHFTPDEHLCVYNNQDDLLKALRQLLISEELRNEIARKGFQKVVDNYTYDHFVQKLLYLTNSKKSDP
jgi:spore maturation protein CgeB